MKVIYRLNKEGSREINKLKDKRESVFFKRSLKSKCMIQLVIRLKAIKYKKNFSLLFIFLFLLLNQLSGFFHLHCLKLQSFLIAYEPFIHLCCLLHPPDTSHGYVLLNPLLYWLSDQILHQDRFYRLSVCQIIQWLCIRSSCTKLCYQAHYLLVTTLLSSLFIKQYNVWLKLILTFLSAGLYCVQL